MTRRGFTLVELLVVIAIIAVLAGIIFPVFAAARGKARQIRCLSNMSQIGLAARLYMTDYSGYVPNWCVSHPCMTAPPDPKDQPAGHVITWDVSLAPYTKDGWKLFVCSENPRGPESRAYAITQYTQFAVGANLWGTSDSYIPNPSDTVLLYEKGANLPGSWGDALGQNLYETHNGPLKEDYDPNHTDPYMNEWNQEIDCQPFHRGGKNMVYVDGHAKFNKYGQGPFARKGISFEVKGWVGDYTDLP